MHLSSEYEHIQTDSDYIELIKTRRALTWPLAVLVGFTYFSFILAIAFFPKSLAVPVAAGHVGTNGIWLGIGLIVLCLLVTAYYLYKANTLLEPLSAKLHSKYNFHPYV